MSEKRPPGCEHCKEKCTIHLTQIVGNQIVKVDLCEQCPHAEKLQDPGQFELLDKILNLPQEEKSGPAGPSCPQCGMTERQFRKSNRFGCAQCYVTFSGTVNKMLPQLHKDITHRGKIPHSFVDVARSARIKVLEQTMEDAVQAEDFEAAAKARDEIKNLSPSDS